MSLSEQKGRGLPSLQQSREQRRRAVVFGKVRIRESAPQFWLWTLVIFAAFGVIYWNISQRELRTRISGVMAKQRAIAQELAPRLLPLRDRVERHVIELAAPWREDSAAPELDLDAVSKSKGLYLRLMLASASTPEAIRAAAPGSLHDGFTSCMFSHVDRARVDEGRQCISSAQCDPGEICNDWRVCSLPTQPYNVRLIYRALRVLSSDWTDDLHRAEDEYQVRVFDNDLDKVAHDDVPIGAQLAQSARFLTVLLDEMPKAGLPPEAPGEDPKGLNRPEVRIQLAEHMVRVGIWDLNGDKSLARMRVASGAEFIPMGRLKDAPESVQRAQQRQVNNCSIATELKERVLAGKTPAPAATP